MNVAILTSSRADFGIYMPLLKKMQEDSFFRLEIIAFGTHLSLMHGYTLNDIEQSGFIVSHKIESLVVGDSNESVATAIGLTQMKFASFWASKTNSYDIVFCLGDRYEMFAAVSAGITFKVRFAHLHGGEKSLGAIDNTFRHAISLMSNYHFVSTKAHADRLMNLLDEPSNIYNVGALSLDNIESIVLLEPKEMKSKWGIDFSQPTILATFHPETVNESSNQLAAETLVNVVNEMSEYNFVFTMPNADSGGNIIRKAFQKNLSNNKRVTLVENFGTVGYFSGLKYCKMVIGNSSSGIIEAASLNKYVVNIGERQKGRATGENVVHVPINKHEIIQAIHQIERKDSNNVGNIYWNGGAAEKIISILKQAF